MFSSTLAFVNTLAYGSDMKPRLTSDDWIFAGFRALVDTGPQALKAEPLARSLGTTKGSFYWHFKDVPDFHAQMLTVWENHAYHAVTQALATIRDPATRLQKLGSLAVGDDQTQSKAWGGPGAEPAIRAWAQANPMVAVATRKIDALRIGYISDILTELDLPDPDLPRIIYAAYIGLGTLSAGDGIANETAMEKVITALLTQPEN